MGYSSSKKTVERAKVLLDKITQLQEGASLEIPTSTPARLAYALRDAFKVASDNPKQFAAYASFKDKYKIKTGFNSVTLVPRDSLGISFGDPITHLGRSSVLTIEEATSFLEVVGAAIKHKAPKMIFPNADGAFDKIKLWCDKNHYEIVDTNPLTLERCEKSMSPTTQDTTTPQPSLSES